MDIKRYTVSPVNKVTSLIFGLQLAIKYVKLRNKNPLTLLTSSVRYFY